LKLKSLRVLVTGGAGYIGSLLIRMLLERGCQVTTVDNLMFGGEPLMGVWHHKGFRFIHGDVRDKKFIDGFFNENKFDAVVHLAAIVGDPACAKDEKLATETNLDASLMVLETSARHNVGRFVFASTCSNYGKMDDPNAYVDETSELNPVSHYARLKVAFERAMTEEMPRKEGFCPVSLRFSTVYGLSPRVRFDLTVNEFTKELALGRELIVFGEQFWRPYCHVYDLANSVLFTLEAEEQKVAYDVYNVGDTAENYQKQMIVDNILKTIPEGKIKYVKKDEDPRDYRVSFEKIKERLGFRITRTVPDGIEEIKYVILNGFISNPDDKKYRNT
jgi:nucleoside-diphosphate-sugar epimerase